MNILGIETSCDETACSIVKDGVTELSNIVASSAELHQKTGGIVPEVAARKQVESIIPVINECIERSGLSVPDEIDAIAVTYGPGLVGSLVVGVAAAKTLSLAWDKPIIPVNHLVGHVYGVFVDNPEHTNISFPAVVLVVSGGHTDIVLMKNHGVFEYLGGTVDDAAGEAFDKVARLLGLSKYLGGVELSKKASECVQNTLAGRLPRPMLDREDYNVSFSGLKTATRRLLENEKPDIATLSCEFETAVVDVLVSKVVSALTKTKARTLILGGGVSANTQLRTRLGQAASDLGILCFLPPLKYCGDAASYIASAAYFNNFPKNIDEIHADPSIGITD